MHLKKHRRPTVQDALRAVRDELGPSALVLSTELVATPGIRGWLGRREVEITAATERTVVSESRPARNEREDRVAGREVVARLQAAGRDPALAREIADAMPSGRRRAASPEMLRRALADQIAPVAAAGEPYAAIEMFVGPPGAGKTTTVASSTTPLLLDTAGRSPKDDASRETFRVLADRRDVRTHLVLPAATSPASARRTLERFQDARPSRLILTKLDESDSIAPLLSVVRDSGIPLSYLGTGQSVPDDLQRATPAVIAAWVMGEALPIGAVA